MKLLDAFKAEDNFTVWSSISNVMSKLNLLLQYTEYHEQYKQFGRRLFFAIEDKLGWEAKPNESMKVVGMSSLTCSCMSILISSVIYIGHLDTMLRSLVLLRMTSFGHEKTIEESKKRFKGHLCGESPIIADLRAVVYRGILSSGDEETLNTVLKVYILLDRYLILYTT